MPLADSVDKVRCRFGVLFLKSFGQGCVIPHLLPSRGKEEKFLFDGETKETNKMLIFLNPLRYFRYFSSTHYSDSDNDDYSHW